MKMKTLWFFVCALCALVAEGFAVSPHNMVKLPIGSAEEMNDQIGKKISGVHLVLTTTSGSGGRWFSPSETQRLDISIKDAMDKLFSDVIKPSDAGSEASFTLLLWYLMYTLPNGSVTRDCYANIGEILPKKFVVDVGPTGKPVIHYDELLNTPLVSFIPIGPQNGVIQVEYLWWDENGREVKRVANENGAPTKSICGVATNGLFLTVTNLATEEFRANGYTGQVRFDYKTGQTIVRSYDGINVEVIRVGSVYDAFDVVTGEKVDSTVVDLWVNRATQGLEVLVTGWPGKRVAMETSSDLRNWTERGIVTLDQSGKAVCLPPGVSGPLFFRGRLLP